MGIKITNENTLIILDWDDTLFPTSWILKNNIDIYNQTNLHKFGEYFTHLDRILFKLFKCLNKLGKVVIVTNALPEWVKISSKLLINSGPLIRSTKVVSARKIYQSISSSSMEWKRFAFNDELTEIAKKNKINNILSVGDAEYEYQALISLYKDDSSNYKLLKSIKFMRYPTHDNLLDQLNVLFNSINKICKKKSHIDMNFKFK
jgi:hypothetical protein